MLKHILDESEVSYYAIIIIIMDIFKCYMLTFLLDS